MILKLIKKIYKPLIISLILLPNLFVVIVGIESFPLTCAPMFGHYIDDETDLYLFKFEGENSLGKTNLVKYYGKRETLFIRHFFSKVYGSTEAISPFSNQLYESNTAFHDRMNAFFNHYYSFILAEYSLSFSKINLMVKKVDYKRNSLTDYETIGYFNIKDKKYYSKL
ncbi:hypothetical protein [Flavivirga sp. 57AJ16]|uniref:hypothetical protein n=1 Tax=Flavivirga sp. 57AJ16 TaxID=3025307 RepID=UPI002365F0D3|nr:hypothetical protein [Flavivirga sp. 57AJ16]MDD7885848.1 hypothetical protein [Flavivirga sp. 57AJ16]